MTIRGSPIPVGSESTFIGWSFSIWGRPWGVALRFWFPAALGFDWFRLRLRFRSSLGQDIGRPFRRRRRRFDGLVAFPGELRGLELPHVRANHAVEAFSVLGEVEGDRAVELEPVQGDHFDLDQVGRLVENEVAGQRIHQGIEHALFFVVEDRVDEETVFEVVVVARVSVACSAFGFGRLLVFGHGRQVVLRLITELAGFFEWHWIPRCIEFLIWFDFREGRGRL